MVTGEQSGELGHFTEDELDRTEGIKIVKIKRSNQKTGLKLYGSVLSDSGKSYNFAYIRRPNFRGWICSCENFFFTMFKKNRNCKHIKFVRQQVGRYGAKVPAVK
jgi:predicted nucleic acid-binding Zn finger protein